MPTSFTECAVAGNVSLLAVDLVNSPNQLSVALNFEVAVIIFVRGTSQKPDNTTINQGSHSSLRYNMESGRSYNHARILKNL